MVGGRLEDDGDGYTKRWEIISAHQKSRKNFSGHKNGLGNRSGIETPSSTDQLRDL